MTEQTESELDWKDVSVLVFVVGMMIAVITALAIHFGYGDALSHGVSWLADQWRQHVIGKYFGDLFDVVGKLFKGVGKTFETVGNYLKQHPLPRRLP